MIFSSWVFLLAFLPLVWLLTFGLARRDEACQRFQALSGLLIGASLVFYSWNLPDKIFLLCLGLLIGSLGFNWAMLQAIFQTPDKKSVVTLGVIGNLLILGFFKYGSGAVLTLNNIFETGFTVPKLFLPLAISFYTFQQISFLVDAGRGKLPSLNLQSYLLHILFFPKLLSGPITRYQELQLQFATGWAQRINTTTLLTGLSLVAVGLAKKVLLADPLGQQFATPVFTAAEQGMTISVLEAWAGVIAYAFSLYFDFSGYADMAIGVAAMFGISLPLNFASPYKAANISAFWQRWHMTLSRFLRDYVYIPLGGNRCGPVRQSVNLMITMVLGGLWHGEGWNFLIWGALHGGYLCINHLWRQATGDWRKQISRVWWYIIASQMLTFLAVLIGWVFFRASTLPGALTLLKAMAGDQLPAMMTGYLGEKSAILQGLGFQFDAGLIVKLGDWVYPGVPLLMGSAILIFLCPNTAQLFAQVHQPPGDSKPLVIPSSGLFPGLRWKPGLAWAALANLCFLYCLLQLTNISGFLYFQF